MSAKRSPVIPTNIFWLASILFFVSGGTGLAYQVVWFKRFAHVWGSSSLALAAVASSFLLGLGLGAYLVGQLSDRIAMPLKWYGVSEILIGLLALLIPLEMTLLVNATASLYAWIPEQVLLRFLVQSSITLLVIGPPCVLMGGTLPLLIRQLTPAKGSLDQATGWLYAINTLGAAVGCYLAGFHIISSIGLWWTNNLMAAVNITLGLISLRASIWAKRRLPQAVRGRSDKSGEKQPWSLPVLGLFLATALTGCAALVLEMTWTRQLAVLLGGSTYAFTATIFVVLIGIAVGSLIFHFTLRRVASSPLVPLVVISILVLAAALGNSLLPGLSLLAGDESVLRMRADPFYNGIVCVGISATLEFLPAVCMGFLFPLFVHLTRAGAARVGSAVGKIYAVNTLGSIVGAGLTAALLFPYLGTSRAVGLAAAMYLVALLAVIPWQGWRAIYTGGVVGIVGSLVVLWIFLQPTDPLKTNLGFYLYGVPVSAGNARGPRTESISELFFREGASTNVLVSREDADLTLRVNGKVDASTGTDMVTQLGLAYFPRIFKHDAEEVLVICYGTGCTPGRSLLFPNTHVTCCEIEPAVFEASKLFGAINGRPHQQTRQWLEDQNKLQPPEKQLDASQIASQARFSIIFGDGRTTIQGSSKKYDLIISEPSHP
ncbi:MAG: fused MFS/spermidine synthase, partial [Planctomycetales bacterium]